MKHFGISENHRRRFARFLLIGGLGFGIVRLLPSMPREQTLIFRFDTGDTPVERLDLAWTMSGKVEPAGGVTLHFDEPARRTLRHTLSLPNGVYMLDIAVHRAREETSAGLVPNPGTARDSVAEWAPSKVGSDVGHSEPPTSYIRRVDLEGGETLIRL